MNIPEKYIIKEIKNITNTQLTFLTLGIVFIFLLGILFFLYSFYNTKAKLNFTGNVIKFNPDKNIGGGTKNSNPGVMGSDPNSYSGLGSADKSMLQCKVGQCAINLSNGIKRCPNSANTQINFDPSTEACTNMYSCDSSRLPYAIKMDGSAGPTGQCEKGVICTCSQNIYCSRNVASSFNVNNGNPFSNSDELKGYFISTISNPDNNYGYSAIEIDDPNKKICKINPSYTNKIKNGCNFINDLGDKTNCNYNYDLFVNTLSGAINVLYQFTKKDSYDLKRPKRSPVNNTSIPDNYSSINIPNQITLLVIDLEPLNLEINNFENSTIFYNNNGTYVLLEVLGIGTIGSTCFCGTKLAGTEIYYPYHGFDDYHCKSKCVERTASSLRPDFNYSSNSIWISIGSKNITDSTTIDNIYLSNNYVEGCVTTSTENNYKNMINCLQNNSQICEIGALSYNVDKVLGDSTSIYDTENSRNFCKYIKNSTNKFNTLKYEEQSGYLKAPEYFTTSCVLGNGCGILNEFGSSASNSKNNFFPFYDDAGVTNSFMISSNDIKNPGDFTISPGDLYLDSNNILGYFYNDSGNLKVMNLENTFSTTEFRYVNTGTTIQPTNQNITVYKQFGFNGINYNTKSKISKDGIIDDLRVYNTNSLYNNVSNSYNGDIYSPRTTFFPYSNDTQTSNNFPQTYENNISGTCIRTINENLSLYYPVWNINTFTQECIMCSPSLHCYVSSFNEKLIIAQIQFCSKLSYEYDFDDSEYYYVKKFKVRNFSDSSNLELTSTDDIEEGDSIYIPSNNSTFTFKYKKDNSIVDIDQDPDPDQDPLKKYISNTLPDSIYHYDDNSIQYQYGKLYLYNNQEVYISVDNLYSVNSININNSSILLQGGNSFLCEKNTIIYIIKRTSSALRLSVSQLGDTVVTPAQLKIDGMCDKRITSINIVDPGSGYNNLNKPLIEFENVYVNSSTNQRTGTGTGTETGTTTGTGFGSGSGTGTGSGSQDSGGYGGY